MARSFTWGENDDGKQRSRSMRLFAIIKSTFANHARTMRFGKEISLASSSVDMNPSVQTSNRFELIRQLTLEYSIRTRKEALTFRTALANKTFALMWDMVFATSQWNSTDMNFQPRVWLNTTCTIITCWGLRPLDMWDIYE